MNRGREEVWRYLLAELGSERHIPKLYVTCSTSSDHKADLSENGSRTSRAIPTIMSLIGGNPGPRFFDQLLITFYIY